MEQITSLLSLQIEYINLICEKLWFKCWISSLQFSEQQLISTKNISLSKCKNDRKLLCLFVNI